RSALSDIRHSIRELVARRDARRDHFVSTIRSAMRRTLGDDADAVLNKLHCSLDWRPNRTGPENRQPAESGRLISRNKGEQTRFHAPPGLSSVWWAAI
ncbi:MAG: hypothetical protein ACK6EB_09950, partial [Planctomyces sp.]